MSSHERVRVGRRGLAASLLCLVGCLVVSGTSLASTKISPKASTITLYSVVSEVQFVNHEDDRARGLGSNPFGNYRGSGLATQNEIADGPLPGDQGLFVYKLYANATLKKSVGTGVLMCEFGFNKTGDCDVEYQLDGGSVIAIGAVNGLARDRFGLVITGGTGTYSGVTGNIEASKDNIEETVSQIQYLSSVVPALVLRSQRLTFVLNRS